MNFMLLEHRPLIPGLRRPNWTPGRMSSTGASSGLRLRGRSRITSRSKGPSIVVRWNSGRAGTTAKILFCQTLGHVCFPTQQEEATVSQGVEDLERSTGEVALWRRHHLVDAGSPRQTQTNTDKHRQTQTNTGAGWRFGKTRRCVHASWKNPVYDLLVLAAQITLGDVSSVVQMFFYASFGSLLSESGA